MFGKLYNNQLKVLGMHCQNCVKRVEETIKKFGGVKGIHIDLGSGNVSFLSKKQIDKSILKEEIENLGFEVGDNTNY